MHEEVAAYVLGVLDEEENEAFERHLDTCTACQAELKRLVGVAGQLDELKHFPAASEDDRSR